MTENRDSTTDHARVAFHPPILLIGAIAGGFVLRAVWSLTFISPGTAAVAGPALTIAALGVFTWSVLTMRRGGASVPTHTPTDALVFSGPYQFSRNPIYISMLGLMVAIAIWSNSLWFIVLAVAMVPLLDRGVIAREERYLEHKFGEAYLAYKQRVRRWL